MTNELPPTSRPPEPLWLGNPGLQSAGGSADGGDFHQYELNAFRFLLGRQPAYGFERKRVTDNAFEVMIQNYAAFLFEYGKTTGSISAHGVGVLGSPAATDKFTFRPNRVGSEQYHLGSLTQPFDNLVTYQELVVNIDITGTLSVSGQDTPAQITSDTNNYTGADGGMVIRLSTDASRTITGMRTGYFDLLTGISNTTSPSLRIIHNVGSFDIVFADESGSSDAEHRFALAGENLTISPDESVIFVYDTTSDRWRAAGVYQVPASSAVDRQTFTSSDTWTKPSTGTLVLIQCWGAGGSGGRAGSTDGGGGGGGGAYVERWMNLSDISGNQTVTIGAGGAARAVDETDGATGGNTTFGAHVTAYGGGGGEGATAANGQGGGGGGVLSAGTVGTGDGIGSLNGGGPAVEATTAVGEAVTMDNQFGGGSGAATNSATGNIGGRSVYGGGGGGRGLGTGAGGAGGASLYGGGGGGGGSGDTSGGSGGASAHGGAGGAGATAAANATDGTAPAGGGGGSETGNSGAGAAGRCIVTVFP